MKALKRIVSGLKIESVNLYEKLLRIGIARSRVNHCGWDLFGRVRYHQRVSQGLGIKTRRAGELACLRACVPGIPVNGSNALDQNF